MGFFDFLKRTSGAQAQYKGQSIVQNVDPILQKRLIDRNQASVIKPLQPEQTPNFIQEVGNMAGGFINRATGGRAGQVAKIIPPAFEKITTAIATPIDMVERASRGELKRDDGSNILVQDLPWWAQAGYAALRGPQVVGQGSLQGIESGLRFLEWQGLDASKPIADKLADWQKVTPVSEMTTLEQVASGIGTSIPFYALGQVFGGSLALLGKVSPAAVALFGGSTAGFMEAASEAGMVYQQLKDKGASQQQIDKLAGADFWANAITLTVMNYLSGLYEPKVDGGMKRQLVSMLRAAPAEGLQEGFQQIVSNLATGQPTSQGVLASVGIGGLIGALLGADSSTIVDEQTQADIQNKILDNQVINPDTVQTRLSDISQKVNMILTGDPNISTELGTKIMALKDGPLEFVDSPGQFYSSVADTIKENVNGEFAKQAIVDPVEGYGYRSKGHLSQTPLGTELAFGEDVLYLTTDRGTAEMYDRQTGNMGVEQHQYWATPDEILDLSTQKAKQDYVERAIRNNKMKIKLDQNGVGNAIRDLAKIEGYKVIVGDSTDGTAILDDSILNPPRPKTSNKLLERMLSVSEGLGGTVVDMWNQLKVDDELYQALDDQGMGLYIANKAEALLERMKTTLQTSTEKATKFVGMLFKAAADQTNVDENVPDVIKDATVKAQIGMGQVPPIIQQAVAAASAGVATSAENVQMESTQMAPAGVAPSGDTTFAPTTVNNPLTVPSSEFNLRNFQDTTQMERYIQQQKADTIAQALANQGYDGYRIGDQAVVTNKLALDEQMKSKQFITTEEAVKQSESFKFIQDLNIPVIVKERILTDAGQQAFGRYSDQVIQFVNNPHATTIPHEAVHAFVDLMTTPDERQQLVAEMRRRYPSRNYTDIQAFEKLAQDFADYYVRKQENAKASAPSSKLKQFFDWMVEKFKTIVGGADKIKQFYKDIETKRPGQRQQREILRRRVLRGGEDLRSVQREYYQEPEKLTAKFLTYKDLGSREFASYQYLSDMLKGAPLKLAERDLVSYVLEQPQFKDKEKIRMQEFKDAVIAEILPIEIIPTDKWADYGLNNTPELKEDVKYSKTYVLNTPFEHGYTGHFDEILSEVGNICFPPKGLLSHVRIAYMQDGTAKVLEIQSDTIQKKAREDLQTTLDSLVEKHSQAIRDLQKRSNTLASAMEHELPSSVGPDLLSAWQKENDQIEQQRSDYIQRMAAIEAGKPQIQDLQQIKYSKQFLQYFNIWHEITMKQAIRLAAMEGATKIQFPSAFTASVLEGWVEQSEGDVGREYTVEDIKFGANIDIYGEGYLILQKFGDGGFQAIRDDGAISSNHWRFSESELQSDVRDQMLESPNNYGLGEKVRDVILNDFENWKKENPKFAGMTEQKIRVLTESDEELANSEAFQKVLESSIEAELENFDYPAYLEDIYGDVYYDQRNGETHYIVFENKIEPDTFPAPSDQSVLPEDINEARELFERHTELSNPRVDGNQKMWFDDLDRMYQGMAYRYEVTFPRYLAKLRAGIAPIEGTDVAPYFEKDGRNLIDWEDNQLATPELRKKIAIAKEGKDFDVAKISEAALKHRLDVSAKGNKVIDDYGYTWFETRIVPEDRGAVEAFQTKESLQQNEEDFALRQEAEQIVAEATKSEKMTVKKLIRRAIGKADEDLLVRTEQQLLKLKLQNIAQGVKMGRSDMRVIMKESLRAKLNDIQLIKDAIVAYAEPLPAEEKGKLLTVVRDAKTEKNLDMAFSRIDAAIFKSDKTEALTDFKKTVKRAKQVLATGNGVAVDYQRQIADILEKYDLKKPTAETMRQLESLQKFLESQPTELQESFFRDADGQPIQVEKAFVPKALTEKIARLAKINPSQMTAGEIRELNDTILQLVTLGKLKNRLQNNYDERTRQHNLEMLIGSTFSLDPNGLLKNMRFDIRKGARIDMLHAPRVTDEMDNYQNYQGQNTRWQRQVSESVNNAELETIATITSVFKQINKLQSSWSESEQATMMFHMLVDMGADTQAQALIDFMGWKDIPKLTEEMQATMAIMRDTFESNVTALSAVSEEVTGKLFERVDNYFPLKYQRGTTMMPDPIIGQKLQRSAKTKQGFTFTRKKNVRKVPRVDVFAVFEEAVREQMYFKNVQPTLYEINRLVREPGYQEKAGELAVSWWKDYIDAVANRGQQAATHSNRLLKGIRINLGKAILGFKVSSILMQPLAIFDAYSYIYARFGVFQAARVLGHFAATWFNPRYAKRVIAQSPALQLRSAGEVALEEIKQRNKGKGLINAYQRGSMKMLQWFDVKTAAAVDQAMYRIFKGKEGVTDQEARAEADLVMNLVSSSSSIADRPMVLMKGEGWRTVLTFQTFILNRWGLITHDLVRAGMVKGSLGRKARSLIALMILAIGAAAEDQLRQLIYKIVTGKEYASNKGQSIPQQMLLDVLWMVPETAPVLGNIIQSQRQWGTGFSVPITRTIDNLSSGIRMLGSSAVDTQKRGALHISESLASLLGIAGTAQAFDIIERLVIPPSATSDTSYSENIFPSMNGITVPKAPALPKMPSAPKPPGMK